MEAGSGGLTPKPVRLEQIVPAPQSGEEAREPFKGRPPLSEAAKSELLLPLQPETTPADLHKVSSGPQRGGG